MRILRGKNLKHYYVPMIINFFSKKTLEKRIISKRRGDVYPRVAHPLLFELPELLSYIRFGFHEKVWLAIVPHEDISNYSRNVIIPAKKPFEEHLHEYVQDKIFAFLEVCSEIDLLEGDVKVIAGDDRVTDDVTVMSIRKIWKDIEDKSCKFNIVNLTF